EPAHEGVRRRRWDAAVPGDQVPRDRPDQRGEYDARVHDARVHDALRDGLGDGGGEDERGDEVEERGPDDGKTGREDPSGDDGGDRVRRVVEPVDEVERQRDQDDRENEPSRVPHQACLMVMDSSTLATSSPWSS